MTEKDQWTEASGERRTTGLFLPTIFCSLFLDQLFFLPFDFWPLIFRFIIFRHNDFWSFCVDSLKNVSNDLKRPDNKENLALIESLIFLFFFCALYLLVIYTNSEFSRNLEVKNLVKHFFYFWYKILIYPNQCNICKAQGFVKFKYLQ